VSLKHQAPRGTRDLLPGEVERWQWAESRARDVLEHYGYREIRTPIFEEYELFARTSGEASDVVQKEMYRFTDLGERELALRPEGTASVCRAYLQHGMAQQGRIHRLWYMGPMFRYGRPQKGRYRQFWQVGAEIIGSPAAGADVEIIALFVDLFETWGFKDLTVTVNSLGTPEVRARYAERLRAWLAPARERLSEDSRRRLETNPLRLLDTKDPDEQKLLAGDDDLAPRPRLLDVLDDESRAHFDQVRAGLQALGITHEIDHGLVRGLDYYTRTAFEVHDRSLGAQSALGGGGRYDGLIEALGGPPTPGVGFSIGLDRVLLMVEEKGYAPHPTTGGVYIVAMEGTRLVAPMLARALRQVYTVDYDLEGRGLNAQMKAADKSGARAVMLLGDEEWQRGEVVLKELKTGAQQTVPLDGIVEALDRILLGETAGTEAP
jgi:histidyl-tRNA synthetase